MSLPSSETVLGSIPVPRRPRRRRGNHTARRSNAARGPGSRRYTPVLTVLLAVAVGFPLLVAALLMSAYRWPLLLACVLAVVFHVRHDVASVRLSFSLLDELPEVVVTYATTLVLVVFAAEYIGNPVWEVRRLTVVLVVSAAIGLAFRSVVHRAMNSARSRGHFMRRALIIGGGPLGLELAATIAADHRYGLVPIGIVDDAPEVVVGDLPVVVGAVSDIPALVERHGCQVIVVAYGLAREKSLINFLWSSYGYQCDVFVVPRLFEISGGGRSREHIGGIPVEKIRRVHHRGWHSRVKRVLDLVVAGGALVALSPVLLGCALAVRATGPQIIFRQPRIGKDGRIFDLLKFRSMHPVTATDSARTWNVVGDPRVTSVGRILRKTSLDELPQLWNILRGQMTLVGPRPERPHFVDQFALEVPGYNSRHRVPVGLTGLAQVSGLRGDTSIPLRIRYDNYYIEHWSLWTDVKVMLRTVREVVGARGG